MDGQCDCRRVQGPAQGAEVEKPVEAAQQASGWNVIVKIEGIEQSLLSTRLSSHCSGFCRSKAVASA
jgi:hypothetical protein